MARHAVTTSLLRRPAALWPVAENRRAGKAGTWHDDEAADVVCGLADRVAGRMTGAGTRTGSHAGALPCAQAPCWAPRSMLNAMLVECSKRTQRGRRTSWWADNQGLATGVTGTPPVLVGAVWPLPFCDTVRTLPLLPRHLALPFDAPTQSSPCVKLLLRFAFRNTYRDVPHTRSPQEAP